MRRLLIILSFAACCSRLYAQQSVSEGRDCSGILNRAEIAYQAGLFLNVIKTLESALGSCDFTRKEKEQALELLGKSYIETGDENKAESTVNILLKNFPHYELKESENPEMYNRLVKKFRIHPLFTIGAKNTGNFLRHKTTEVYSVLDGIDYSKPLEESGYWFTYYGMAEYEFIEDLSVNIDMMFFLSNYSRTFSKNTGFNLSYWENDGFIEFPVYLKKYFHISKNLLAYASGGAGLYYMWKARGNVELKYTTADIITGKNADFDSAMYNMNLLPYKNRGLVQWNAGVGIGYKLKNLRLFLDARYLSCIGSTTAPEKSDLFPALKNDFFYINQKMRTTQFEVGATISYTLFNSVKRIRK